MNYKIELSKKAQKFILKLEQKEQQRILKAIYKLPFDGDIKQLKGLSQYRLRVGEYRIIYEMYNDVLLIRVINIGNRGDVYKTT
ncbi:UNVERIFIED_CONTAM: mRNA interferase RelE/StbE [Acetivibrio alkalicellulosi]